MDKIDDLTYLDFDSLFGDEGSESIKAYFDLMKKPKKAVQESSKIFLLLSLGWEDEGYNGFGRRIFKLGDYYLFEHQGEIGILTEEDKYEYCEMSKDEIDLYTKKIRWIIEIDNHDDCYTLYDYRRAKEELKQYTERLIYNHDDRCI